MFNTLTIPAVNKQYWCVYYVPTMTPKFIYPRKRTAFTKRDAIESMYPSGTIGVCQIKDILLMKALQHGT